MKTHLKIGTRGSPLALTQASMVEAALKEKFPALATEIVIIKTSGDWSPKDGEVRLSEAQGGKGQFAKEIEAALLSGKIDLAVHSMKDMDSNLPDGLALDHMLPRQDPRDAIIIGPVQKNLANFSQLKWGKTIEDLSEFLSQFSEGVCVGTASVRRAAYLKNACPGIEIAPLRGNVQTRLDKLAADQVDMTLLAMAGLNRLGLAHVADAILSENAMLPAAGQGAVGVEIRSDDNDLRAMLDQISCAHTVLCVKAERAAVKVLDGTCHTPISAYAMWDENGEIFMRLCVLSLSGNDRYEAAQRALVKDVQQAESVAIALAEDLKRRMPADILA